MNVDPTEPAAHQASALQEREHLFVIRNRHRGQRADQLEDFAAPRQISTGKLADDERVSPNQPVFQQPRESRVALPQMVDPNRRVNEQSSTRGL